MSVDESLLCSFQVHAPRLVLQDNIANLYLSKILKPAEKKQKYVHGEIHLTRPAVPVRVSKLRRSLPTSYTCVQQVRPQMIPLDPPRWPKATVHSISAGLPACSLLRHFGPSLTRNYTPDTPRRKHGDSALVDGGSLNGLFDKWLVLDGTRTSMDLCSFVVFGGNHFEELRDALLCNGYGFAVRYHVHERMVRQEHCHWWSSEGMGSIRDTQWAWSSRLLATIRDEYGMLCFLSHTRSQCIISDGGGGVRGFDGGATNKNPLLLMFLFHPFKLCATQDPAGCSFAGDPHVIPPPASCSIPRCPIPPLNFPRAREKTTRTRTRTRTFGVWRW